MTTKNKKKANKKTGPVTVWACVDKETGDPTMFAPTRRTARENRTSNETVRKGLITFS